MVNLDAAQTENLSTALVVARAWAVASGNDPVAVSERVAFCAWTESRGYIYANDGRNTSNSPGFTSTTAATLRRSLNLPHDQTGSNGRSTGMYQQTSEDVGGGWGDMAGTMDPAISTARFLARLVVTDNAVYAGTLLTPTGTRRVAVTLSSAAAADVLRVQQPLADEAESSNYDATQVATAREIVAQLSPAAPTGAGDVMEWMGSPMADQAALAAFAEQIQDAGPGRQFQLYRGPASGGGKVLAVGGGRAYHVPNGGVVGLGQADSVKLFSKDILDVDQNVMNWLDEIVDDKRVVRSRVDHQEYDRDEFLSGMDEKQNNGNNLLAQLIAKVDALGAALDSRP
jgi:hypothetical protein